MGTASSGTLPAETHIGRTALRVTDREAVTDFYRRVVGLDVLAAGKTTTLGVDGTPLLVLAEDDGSDGRHDRAGTGLYHTAVRLPSRGALGDALGRIRAEWHLDGATDHRVSEALYLTDPEGNGVEIYRDRPREAWPVDDDGRVRMPNDPLDLDDLAGDATGGGSAPPGTDIGHVHLSVSSLDAVRSFYVGTLGFEVRAAMSGAVFLAAGGYHHHIGANTWHHRHGRDRSLAWFEVVLPTAAALDAVRERLVGHETPVRATDQGFAVSDPDDIEIRVRAAD